MLETIYIVFICLLALWQLLCAPFVLAGADFGLLVITYVGAIVTIFVSIVLGRIMAGQGIKITFSDIYKGCGRILTLIFALILMQLFLSVVLINDSVAVEDSVALVHANVANITGQMYNTDTLTGEEIGLDTDYALESWPMLLAMVARLTGLPVATVAHTVMPPILILLAYISYFLLGRALFKKSRDRLLFLLVLTAINMVAYYSSGAVSYSLLSCSWQSSALAKAVLFPFAFYLFPKVFKTGFTMSGIAKVFVYSIAVSCCGWENTLLYCIMCTGLIVCFCVQGRHLKPLRYMPFGLFMPVVFLMVQLALG